MGDTSDSDFLLAYFGRHLRYAANYFRVAGQKIHRAAFGVLRSIDMADRHLKYHGQPEQLDLLYRLRGGIFLDNNNVAKKK